MTNNTNQSDSALDLNQLKIRSSALKSSFPLIFSMLCLGGAGGGALLQIISERSDKNIASTFQEKSSSRTTNNTQKSSTFGNKPRPSIPTFDSPRVGGAERVQFGNLEYAVTNKICNNKKSFCIYNLANLILEKKSKAYYTFSENNPKVGLITINGYINVSKIERKGDRRLFTFEWKDDLRSTSDGYAAMGTFRLEKDPDPNKKGILTKFKTTKSFGDKTPVGLENTSYLFPQ